MAELNEEGRTMALNYIDLLKGSEKYQAAPVRILQPVRILNLYDKKGTYLISLNDKYDPIEIAERETFKTFGRVVS